jgi:hypothetical protein
MKKLIKTCKNPLILSAMLFSLAIPAMAGNDTYSPAIREWVNGVSKMRCCDQAFFPIF